MSDPKTIEQAINETTESDLDAATAADDGAAAAEGTGAEKVEDEAEGETPPEGEEAGAESAESAEDEEDEEDEGEDGEDDDDSDTPSLEDLTAEQLAAIKADPAMAKLYKSLMRATTKKWQRASNALRLVDAYQKDPVGVLSAIARSNGFAITRAEAAAAVGTTDDPIASSGKKVEALFGEKVGPQVRQVLDEYIDARTGKVVGPLQNTLGRVVNQGEAARMMAEEQSFKMRHRELLTPDIEKEVIALGESGRIVPGPQMTPKEYLDTLLDVVVSKRSVRDATKARKDAATKLRDRINRNRSDREPTGVGAKAGVGKGSAIKPGMSLSEAFDVAAKELDEDIG